MLILEDGMRFNIAAGMLDEKRQSDRTVTDVARRTANLTSRDRYIHFE